MFSDGLLRDTIVRYVKSPQPNPTRKIRISDYVQIVLPVIVNSRHPFLLSPFCMSILVDKPVPLDCSPFA